MSSRGKLTESVKRQWAFITERLTGTATTTFYNGYSATTGAVGIDTREYDDIDVTLMPGTVLGEFATVTNSLYAGTTNNPMAASLVTGATYTAINSANDETIREGSVQAKSNSRFFFLVTEVQTSGSVSYTADFAALASLGRPDSQAVSKTLDFDVA